VGQPPGSVAGPPDHDSNVMTSNPRLLGVIGARRPCDLGVGSWLLDVVELGAGAGNVTANRSGRLVDLQAMLLAARKSDGLTGPQPHDFVPFHVRYRCGRVTRTASVADVDLIKAAS
jgi:hypothetical protein